jgi:fibro-slime domain-containing protein
MQGAGRQVVRAFWLLGALAALAGCSSATSSGDGDIDRDGGDDAVDAGGGTGGRTDTIDLGGGGTPGSGGGEQLDPCDSANPPAECELDYEPSGPGCGDGEVNVAGEECDDGNGLPGDGCSGLCLVEPNYTCDDSGCVSTTVCGDGVTQPGEVCDDGGVAPGDGCAADCLSIDSGYDCPPLGGPCSERDPCLVFDPPPECFPDPGDEPPFCGDGSKNNSWEECDDGDTLPGDGCNGACKVEPSWDCTSGTCVSTIVCGDGVVSGGEVCDDGDTSSTNGCSADCFSVIGDFVCPPEGGDCVAVDPCTRPNPPSSCDTGGGPSTPKYCGDGAVNVTGEQCDDGDTLPGDGCSGACKVEPNWDCSSGTCVSTIVCGDGAREGTELCDDGNAVSGDGCSDGCSTLDPNFSCPPAGGSCTSTVVCNDGRITGSEECEDGDKTSGDGCSSTCRLEPGYYCPTVGAPCQPVPYCGDGAQSPDEECDDAGSTQPGCSADCEVEPGYACPTPGEPCTKLELECGDGKLAGSETCDDGDKTSGDGCSASCTVESGFNCGAAGEACLPICGDGLRRGTEACDDGDTDSGDGCSASCTWEPGFACNATPPHSCTPDTCGNGKVGNDEACDDGNARPFDGCAPDCTIEPTCSNAGDVGCSSACGDGLVIGEECDDGNKISGDGCSSTCRVETGFSCAQPTGCAELSDWDHDRDLGTAGIPTCVQRVPVVYRDFNAAHVDMEPRPNSVVNTGLVSTTLDAQGKPVFVGTPNQCWTGAPCITSVASFGQWFRDVGGTTNSTIYGELLLWDRDRDPGASSYDPTLEDVFFVNRWGDEGQKWALTSGGSSGSYLYCGNPGECPVDQTYDKAHCTCSTNWDGGAIERSYRPECNESAPGFRGCLWDGGNWYTLSPATPGTTTEYEGDPTFFPIDGHPSLLSDTRYEAGIAPDYGGNWDAESNYVPGAGTHNFHFTSEIRRWFEYEAAKTYELEFIGDDDVWVFVNGRLAVDLGSFHPPAAGSVTLSSANAASFGLVDGRVYEIAMFQAERKVAGSTYYLTLNGFNFNPSICGSTCGDGVVASDEQCEPSLNSDCTASCTLGSYCGDGVKDADEECDNGSNLSGYNASAVGACAPGCVKPARCGDGQVDYAFGEVCDAGVANSTAYGACTPSCQLGPRCGDGTEQKPPEECDDGVNDGGYGQCAPGCEWGSFCGDGYVDGAAGETCDDGENDGSYGGCTQNCLFGPRCGDGAKNGSEACDDGKNDGSYGGCGLGCTAGPRCGDGEVDDPSEECDDGVNDGQVSACVAGCVWGPYCGDGVRDADEDCDDGVNDGGYGQCAPGCAWGPRCGDEQIQVGEECDDGVNDGGYGECAQNCQLGPYCGDGQLSGSETCDDGENDGSYGGCTAQCTVGPYCGDSKKAPEEQCDDGKNDGSGVCQPGCVFGPGCGDGVLQVGEQCDLGPLNSYLYGGCFPDGAPAECTWGPRCGDGIKQAQYEQCDDGANPGGYGQCAQNCRFGPYCGDGVVNGTEVCDDGVNDGGYGECAPACKLGPYCGDGKKDPEEQCDDGNRRSGDGCSASCIAESVVK